MGEIAHFLSTVIDLRVRKRAQKSSNPLCRCFTILRVHRNPLESLLNTGCWTPPSFSGSHSVGLTLLVLRPHVENHCSKLIPIALFKYPLQWSPITTSQCTFLCLWACLLLDSWLSKAKGHKFAPMCQSPNSVTVYKIIYWMIGDFLLIYSWIYLSLYYHSE